MIEYHRRRALRSRPIPWRAFSLWAGGALMMWFGILAAKVGEAVYIAHDFTGSGRSHGLTIGAVALVGLGAWLWRRA